MAGEVLSEKEALSRLGITLDELNELVREGKLTPTTPDDAQERQFSAEEIRMLAGETGAEAELGGVEEGDDILFDLDSEGAWGEEGTIQSGQEKAGESDLFDFDDDFGIGESGKTDSGDQPAGAAPAGQEGEEGSGLDEFDFLLQDEEEDESAGEDAGARAKEESGGEDVEEDMDFLLLDEDAAEGPVQEPGAEDGEDMGGEDMITELVDVSELEGGEEDLLSDVIEDSSSGISTDDEEDDLSAADLSYTQDPTSDITDLGEETDVFDSADPTSDITQLGDEDFGEEGELAGEGADHDTKFDAEELMAEGGALVRPEPPFPVWTVIILALIMVIQLLGFVFIVENTIQPEQPSRIGEALDIVRFFR